MNKIVRKGFVQAMNGTELWVNTQTDEMIKFVEVTIEIIDESDL